MPGETSSDLVALHARKFTRAAAKFYLSQSALSDILRGLETWLGLRL